MSWWDIVCELVQHGDTLYTPGRGLQPGASKKPFTIISKDASKIEIKSGKSIVPLHKECFDIVESDMTTKSHLWLRVAALHDNIKLENSVDGLIRNKLESQLARGNYVCAILERCRIVKYAMQGSWKVVELPPKSD
jgi:hypothetical protein